MEPIEEMSAFFAKRVDEYDAHMLANVEGIEEAYALVARLLPEGTRTLLDLGCGTGLELRGVFARFPNAHVTGIDLTREMLDALSEKYRAERLTLICGDYFAVDFGIERFDAALSFQSLHHFTHGERRGLYRRVREALLPGGVYVEADYTVKTQREEDARFSERERLRAAMENPARFLHYDVPLTAENQLRLLREAGFASVRLAKSLGNMGVFVAQK